MVTRLKNTDYRSREYLTHDEVKELIATAEIRGRYGLRDKALLLLMFRHGLRVGEACLLRWDAIDLKAGTIFVTRLKRGNSGNHFLQSDEVELLAELKGDRQSGHVFIGERGNPLTTMAIGKIVDRTGNFAEFPFRVHPHMLRHGCGYWLANQGYDTRLIQEWMGHRNIVHTARYTAISPARFKCFKWG
ncbi:MAG: tyrosine-type recombinase/integrase [Scytolyngbya sp. HA4215-MV1]|nr:tyrosine-type recombinase/integrase [Scytolyngbya sp. HA4215-MV1]